MPERRYTVTITDGRRYSVDVRACSTYDAGHLFVTHATRGIRKRGCRPSRWTKFEVVVSGKVHQLKGRALQRWIDERRQEWKGPAGTAF